MNQIFVVLRSEDAIARSAISMQQRAMVFNWRSSSRTYFTMSQVSLHWSTFWATAGDCEWCPAHRSCRERHHQSQCGGGGDSLGGAGNSWRILGQGKDRIWLTFCYDFAMIFVLSYWACLGCMIHHRFKLLLAPSMFCCAACLFLG